MPDTLPRGVVIRADPLPAAARVLTGDALAFVAELHRRFDGTRRSLLAEREARQARIDAGERPALLDETRTVRESDWVVAPMPPALRDRRVEITGPVERKMMINALNSGANVFMADFEDATSPRWENVVNGQLNCIDAVRRTLAFEAPDGRNYQLADRVATLCVRPRGWHLVERHLEIDGGPASASLVDFGLYFFHNAKELLARGAGPYFYLPKLESHREARLWNEVFLAAQELLGVPRGTIRATVLIETVLAAFEMDEILYELREHASGLNAGRWDYIFSAIKKLRADPSAVLPDRAQVTMTVPFMRAYSLRLVATCRRRRAQAIGGMAAFVPSRRDAAVNERAFARVREDKEREAGDGFDGTWVAHPDLVAIAREQFDRAATQARTAENTLPDDTAPLLDIRVPGGQVTETGIHANVAVALEYIAAWLGGYGAVAIDNLMEDTATAEIARAQLWQWIRHGTRTVDGEIVTRERYRAIRDDALATLRERGGPFAMHLGAAADLLDELVVSERFTDFLTLPGYERLA